MSAATTPERIEEILAAIQAALGGDRTETKLSGVLCPGCRDEGREAYVFTDNPHVIHCPRGNHCMPSHRTRDVPELSHLYQNFSKRHPASKADPHATARAWLEQVRGLDVASLTGRLGPDWFSQGVWTDQRGEFKGMAMPTVFFTFGPGRKIKNHRIMEPPAGCKKTRTFPAFKGHCWALGAVERGQVWVTEGVIDALSLVQGGISAVASIASGVVPTEWLAQLDPAKNSIVIAYDGDKAGREGRAKLAAAAKMHGLTVAHAEPPPGQDWNDCLRSGLLKPAPWPPEKETENRGFIRSALERGQDWLTEMDWQAQLDAAESAREYFEIWQKRRGTPLFVYKGSYWVGNVKRVKEDDEVSVHRVTDHVLKALYTIEDRPPWGGDPVYSFRVAVQNHRHKMDLTLSGEALSATTKYKSTMLSGARCHFLGQARDLDHIVSALLEEKAPVVRQTGLVGYQPDTDIYVYPNTAVARDGAHVRRKNDEDYFRVGDLRVLMNAPDDEVHPDPTGELDIPALIDSLFYAWGDLGLAVLGYYTASLFATQMRRTSALGWFPFLSLWGPPNTGKSTLIGVMNRMLGREVDEGISANKSDTAKGLIRAMAVLSNLPVAVLEMGAAEAERFDLNRILPLFNGNPLQRAAAKSHGNESVVRRFYASLVFGQNAEPFYTEAQHSRVVSLYFPKDPFSDAQVRAFNALKAAPVAKLGHYRPAILSRRGHFLEAILEQHGEETRWLAERGVNGEGATDRVAATHGLVCAATRAVLEAFMPGDPIERVLGVRVALRTQALDKIKRMSGPAGPVAELLDIIDLLLRTEKITDHAPQEVSDTERWISMAEVEQFARVQDITASKKLLRDSPVCIQSNASEYSRVQKDRLRVWKLAKGALLAGTATEADLALDNHGQQHVPF